MYSLNDATVNVSSVFFRHTYICRRMTSVDGCLKEIKNKNKIITDEFERSENRRSDNLELTKLVLPVVKIT